MRSWLTRWWLAFAHAVGDFFEEAIFRQALAFNVLVGRVPQRTDKRSWVRSVDVPVLADVYDWTTDRLLYSILVWPPLESPGQDASSDHHQRVEEVLEAISKGANEKMWSVYWEVDYGLEWDHSRECWVDGDGYRYDGSRFGVGLTPVGGHTRVSDVTVDEGSHYGAGSNTALYTGVQSGGRSPRALYSGQTRLQDSRRTRRLG